jgi:SAM-dependent methyltransferase
MLSAQDKLNQSVWSTATARRDLDYNQTYTDDGERAALALIRHEVKGKPILDLGVGRGRTIPLLAPLTDDYRALDYMPQMVAMSRKKHPGVRVELGDARELVGMPSEHFGLVQFSYNGIDAVRASERGRVFSAVRRVLAPGGVFLFSALNLGGPASRQRPWHLSLPQRVDALRFGVRLARSLAWTPFHVVKWFSLQRHSEAGDGYAVAPLPAHHWSLVTHYTTLSRQLDELEREGFERDPVVFENQHGRRVQVGDDTSSVDWFHFIARRA